MKTLVILNPQAGQTDPRPKLTEAIQVFHERGWNVTLQEMDNHDQASLFATQALDTDCQVILVAGGDGTINQVVNAIANTEIALGVLPIGTGNVWARQIGLPVSLLGRTSLQRAARLLVEGAIDKVDLGLARMADRRGAAGKRYFLLWAGAGFDAQVTKELDRNLKRRLGALAFILSGLRLALRYPDALVHLNVDGQQLSSRAYMVEISNVSRYAAILSLNREASVKDGLLEVSLFPGRGAANIASHFLGMLLGHPHPRVQRYRGSHIRLASASPLPVQVDGDPIGTTPAEFVCLPRALSVLLPRESTRLVPSVKAQAKGG